MGTQGHRESAGGFLQERLRESEREERERERPCETMIINDSRWQEERVKGEALRGTIGHYRKWIISVC